MWPRSGESNFLVRRETRDIGTIKLVLTAWRLEILNIKMKPFRPNSKLVWDRVVDWEPLVPSVTYCHPMSAQAGRAQAHQHRVESSVPGSPLAHACLLGHDTVREYSVPEWV